MRKDIWYPHKIVDIIYIYVIIYYHYIYTCVSVYIHEYLYTPFYPINLNYRSGPCSPSHSPLMASSSAQLRAASGTGHHGLMLEMLARPVRNSVSLSWMFKTEIGWYLSGRCTIRYNIWYIINNVYSFCLVVKPDQTRFADWLNLRTSFFFAVFNVMKPN